MESTQSIAVRLAENAAAYIDAHGWRRDGNDGPMTEGRCMMRAVTEVLREDGGLDPNMAFFARPEYLPALEMIIHELAGLIRLVEPCENFTAERESSLAVHYNDHHCSGQEEAADLLRKTAKRIAQ